MNPEKMFHKWGLIGQVSIVGTVLIIILGLLTVSLFYFFSSKEESEAPIQTVQLLKLLNSHSRPEAGEEWGVSFKTAGAADLTITPEDLDSINDLDFVSMKCAPSVVLAEEGFGQEVNPEIQGGDVLFVPNWSCDGVGIVAHLVNIARKHTLRFRFGNKAAFAYNNPDSVTDSFNDESKIAATSSVVITGGQAQLAICADNGGGCSVDGDCCSNNCDNSICCAQGQTCCSGDGHCPSDSCDGICTRINNYCDTVTDHYCKSTPIYCDNEDKCSSGSCILGSCDTGPANCDKICDAGSCRHQNTSEDEWSQCSSQSCIFKVLNEHSGSCNTVCGNTTRLTGLCNSAGGCNLRSCDCTSVGTDINASNGNYCQKLLRGGCTEPSATCGSTMANASYSCTCQGLAYDANWTRCQCGG